MRTPMTGVLAAAVLLALVAVVWLIALVVARSGPRPDRAYRDRSPGWLARWRAARRRSARERARWESFSRQSDRDPDRWDVGIELVADDGRTVLDTRLLRKLRGGDAMTDLLDVEGQAQAWAGQLNAQTRRPR